MVFLSSEKTLIINKFYNKVSRIILKLKKVLLGNILQ